MAAAVHEAGGRLALQISHAGLWASPDAGTPAAGGGDRPSPRTRRGGAAPRPLGAADRCGTDRPGDVADRYRRGHEAFGAAAGRAQAAGCDAVQIHGAHGYLLSEFLSPFFNRRSDGYGGGAAGRTRLVVEVAGAVRAAVGPDYPVLIKMNSEDFVAGGLTVDDMLESAALVAEAGVDAIELSGGTSLSGDLGPIRTRRGIPQDREAYYQDAALRLKQRVIAPVMLVGGIRTFAEAERLVAEGYTDYIALSRPLICEPDLVARWERGDRGSIDLPVGQSLLLQRAETGGHALRTQRTRLRRSGASRRDTIRG